MNNSEEKDIELDLIKDAVEKSDKLKSMLMNQSKDISKIFDIVETFIKKKELICYGGTAINNILPKKYQFYDKNVDIPDYDVYSTTPLEDSKEIADIYAKEGYLNVEVRPAVHIGTFKVSVMFIPVLDLTHMDNTTFELMKKDAVVVNSITYAPVNYLRMSMYKELSHPSGDISRWEKVFKRLTLLNHSYPMKNKICDKVKFDGDGEEEEEETKIEKEKEKEIFENVKNVLIKNKSVFIGEFAASLYGKYMSKEHKHAFNKERFHIETLSADPIADTKIVKAELKKKGYSNIKIIEREPIGHMIDVHYEIMVNNIPICLIYKSKGCFNYNTIKREKKDIRVGTIDSIMTVLLAAMYTGRPYYNNDKLLCMAQFLFIIQVKNKVAKKGLLKRFTLDCIGYEQTLQDMREEKTKKYRLLKNDRSSKEFQELFFKYNPNEEKELRELEKEKKKKKNKSVKLLNVIKTIVNNKNKKTKKNKKTNKNLLEKLFEFES